MATTRSSAPQTQTITEYVIPRKELGSQAKQQVSIDIEVLNPSSTFSHPELFSFNEQMVPATVTEGLKFFPPDARGQRWCYTFGFGDISLTAFKVTLRNDTPHILRMKDARIYLVVPDRDPIAAVTTIGNPELIPATLPGVPSTRRDNTVLPASYANRDGSLVHWLTHFEAFWDEKRRNETRKTITIGFLEKYYPIGFASQVLAQNAQNYKLINDFAAEILPGMSRSGILLFPELVASDTAKLRFYDITVKTDPAGNPTEKTTFEFPLVLERSVFTFDNLEKRWVKTTRTGQSSEAPATDTQDPEPSTEEEPSGAAVAINAPPVEGTPAPPSAHAVVSVEGANLRFGPSTNEVAVSKATKGDMLPILAKLGSDWLLVRTPNGQQAWISTSVVIVSPPGVTIPEWSK